MRQSLTALAAITVATAIVPSIGNAATTTCGIPQACAVFNNTSSNGYGVEGDATGGIGVHGVATKGPGIRGFASTGVGVSGGSTSGSALPARRRTVTA